MALSPTTWGADPEFVGPRHAARQARVVRLIGAALPPGARVLDVGCGGGRLAERLAARGYHLTGVDASAASVAEAARRVPAGSFSVADATALPFPAMAFDAVVAGEVLEHLADDAAAAELFRVLAPGGLAVVTVPADPARWDASDEWAGHQRRYTPEQLEALLGEAGFEAVEVRRYGWPWLALYHRRIYLPMLVRKVAAGDRPTPPLTGWRALASQGLAWLFEVDRLFDGLPGGIGLLAVARKPAAGMSQAGFGG